MQLPSISVPGMADLIGVPERTAKYWVAPDVGVVRPDPTTVGRGRGHPVEVPAEELMGAAVAARLFEMLRLPTADLAAITAIFRSFFQFHEYRTAGGRRAVREEIEKQYLEIRQPIEDKIFQMRDLTEDEKRTLMCLEDRDHDALYWDLAYRDLEGLTETHRPVCTITKIDTCDWQVAFHEPSDGDYRKMDVSAVAITFAFDRILAPIIKHLEASAPEVMAVTRAEHAQFMAEIHAQVRARRIE